MKKIFSSGLLGLAVVVAAVFGISSVAPSVEAARPGMTIYDTAMAANASGPFAGSFDVLLEALERTGLDASVDGRRQLTVFAPTDSAFAKLGINMPSDLDALSNEDLTKILLYHVAPGNRGSSAVVNSSRVNTLQKGFIMVDGTVLNGASNIIVPDIAASNGVIHVIDTVLMPK